MNIRGKKLSASLLKLIEIFTHLEISNVFTLFFSEHFGSHIRNSFIQLWIVLNGHTIMTVFVLVSWCASNEFTRVNTCSDFPTNNEKEMN